MLNKLMIAIWGAVLGANLVGGIHPFNIAAIIGAIGFIVYRILNDNS